jgi:uroporphyrinogen decarboxylase
VVADMMDIELSFVENKGPVFDKVIRTEKDLNKIEHIHDIEKLDYVFNTIKLLKKELLGKKPLIGFIGSPWTVATYIIEGNSSKTFTNVRKMLEGDEKLLHRILDMLTNISINYLNKQIEAGIDVAMIFDTWGSLLNDEQYEKFSLRYINKIKNSISNQDIPLIYYVRETGKKLEALKNLNIDVLGIDSTTEIGVIKKQIGDKFALQGNLDVNVLKKDENDIIIEIKNILKSYGSNSGHVFNLGTGITPDINPDKVKILIDNLADISSKINVK